MSVALPLTFEASYCCRACGLCMENDGSISADGILLETRVNARSTVVGSLAVQDLKRLGGRSSRSFLANPPMTSCQYGVTSGLCIRPLELYQRSKFAQTA